MFTSRAEYRLQLREDNADWRLTEQGRHLGIVDDVRWDAYCRKRDAVAAEIERMKSTRVSPALIDRHEAERVLGQPLEREYTLADLLRRPGVTYGSLHTLEAAGVPADDSTVADQVEVSIKYQGYIDRQQVEVQRGRDCDQLTIPSDIDYASVRGLSVEVRQKLDSQRPETLGHAARISGITPAAISLLLVHLKRGMATERPATRAPAHPA
jgi:tRNA uridine 5-carboxymethylaminomethyl modification enzyme